MAQFLARERQSRIQRRDLRPIPGPPRQRLPSARTFVVFRLSRSRTGVDWLRALHVDRKDALGPARNVGFPDSIDCIFAGSAPRMAPSADRTECAQRSPMAAPSSRTKGRKMSSFLFRISQFFDNLIDSMEMHHWGLSAIVLMTVGYLWLRRGQA
jgi:hypothetical protein